MARSRPNPLTRSLGRRRTMKISCMQIWSPSNLNHELPLLVLDNNIVVNLFVSFAHHHCYYHQQRQQYLQYSLLQRYNSMAYSTNNTTRCLVIILCVSLHTIDAFVCPESYRHHVERPCRQILLSSSDSVGGIVPRAILLSSTRKATTTRPETSNIDNNMSNNESSSHSNSSITPATGSAKSKRYSFSQLVDDVWGNEGGRVDQSPSPQLSSSTLSTIGSDTKSTIQEDSSSASSAESDSTTKLILIGGTILVIVAAWALAVNMGNELGIDLEFG